MWTTGSSHEDTGWECVVIQLAKKGPWMTPALSNAFCTQVLGTSQCSEQTLKEMSRSRMGSPMHRVSLGDTWSWQVHPDIDSERHSPSFSVERLTNILDGGLPNTVLRRKVGKQRRAAKSCL